MISKVSRQLLLILLVPVGLWGEGAGQLDPPIPAGEPMAFAVEIEAVKMEGSAGQLLKTAPSGPPIEVVVDLSLLRRAVLHADDVLEARLSLRGRMEGSAVVRPGVDLQSEGLRLVSGELAKAFREALAEGEDRLELRIEAESGELAVFNREANLDLKLKSHPKAMPFAFDQRPIDGEYVTVKDGNFYYQGRRLRLWGGAGDLHRSADFAQRHKQTGFNAYRLWGGAFYDDESGPRGEFAVTPKGSGEGTDRYDLTFARLKEAGIFINSTALMAHAPVKYITQPGSFLDDGSDDFQAWAEALNAPPPEDRQSQAHNAMLAWYRYFDPRLREARKKHIAAYLAHRNPYTGKTYADEEAIFLHELQNENGLLKWCLDEGFDDWHPYFRKQLVQSWNQWLSEKYEDEADLLLAWDTLDDGESLDQGTIHPGPIPSQRAGYAEARVKDFVSFLIDRIDASNQDLRNFARGQGTPGKGVAVVPFSFDTLYRNHLPWAYSISRGDVANFGIYLYPSKSMLDSPPGLYVMDQNTVDGLPTVIYETNQGRTSPYRTEFPFRVALLALQQDWDAVFFHYSEELHRTPTRSLDARVLPEEYLTAPMLEAGRGRRGDNSVKHHTDPVMSAALAMAGQLFIGGHLAPAGEPVIYSVGPAGSHGFKYLSGIGMARDVFSRGARLRFDPEQEEPLLVNGKPPAERPRLTHAVPMGEHVLWDWPNRRLLVDSPTAKVFIGPWNGKPVRFSDGIVLSGINQPWVSFALISSDGKPLVGADATSRAVVSAVFEARNTGYDVNWEALRDKVFAWPIGDNIRSPGRAPVIVENVDYTLSFPTQMNGEFVPLDFAGREIAREVLEGQNAVSVRDTEVWVSEILIHSRGDAVEALVAESPVLKESTLEAGATQRDGDRRLAGMWSPLNGIPWDGSFDATLKRLQNWQHPYASLVTHGEPGEASRRIVLTGCPAVLGTAAEITLAFTDGGMHQITVAFTDTPSFRGAVEDYETRFGPARNKIFSANAFEDQSAEWTVPADHGGAALDIVFAEHQGSFSIEYQVKP